MRLGVSEAMLLTAAGTNPGLLKPRARCRKARGAIAARGLIRDAEFPPGMGVKKYAVGKPFHFPELAARIASVLRRARARRERGLVQVGELRIDPASREVQVDERKIELSAKEFALLHTLAANPVRVFTKEELLRDVWGFKLMGTSRRGPLSVAFTRERQRAGRSARDRRLWSLTVSPAPRAVALVTEPPG
jgi:hypothetical protein